MADNRFFSLIRTKRDNEGTKPTQAVPLIGGPTVQQTLINTPHTSDGLGDNNPNGRQGNDFRTPTPEITQIEQGGARRQDVARTYLGDGILPGRIPHFFNERCFGKVGKENTPAGITSLLLNISGDSAGGLGDAQYIPHTSVLRPSGKASGSLRTINDGAQIPGVFIADPTRR